MRKGRILFVCLLSGLMIVSISQSAIIKGKVTSVQGNAIEMDAGSEKGIKLGDLGRVYYVIQIEGKRKGQSMWPSLRLRAFQKSRLLGRLRKRRRT